MADDTKAGSPYETGMLTDEELAKIRAEAKAKVQREIHDKLFADALEEAEREERLAAGLTPKTGSTKLDEPKFIVTLDLPESVTPVPALVIDGRAYYDRQTYHDVPQSLAMQIGEMQARAWENDSRMSKGREKDLRRPKPKLINGASGAVSDAPLALVAA